MKLRAGLLLCATVLLMACKTDPKTSLVPGESRSAEAQTSLAARTNVAAAEHNETTTGHYVGFDRNLYPGDARLATLHQHFAFAGYWLNVPPGESENTWTGKRQALLDAGFGFLVLSNGRLDAQIRRSKLSPTALGRQDAGRAMEAARREGFPQGTVLFLDQEEGGRLLPEQAEYFFAWTEAVAASEFRVGAYLSGQPSNDGTGPGGKALTITTAQDVREQVEVRHLHPIIFWVSQDACPPAPGCTLTAPRLPESGTADAAVWQYAQSPRRPELTRSCAKTYGADGLCYAGVTNDVFLDLNVAASPDPSHGRGRPSLGMKAQ